MITRAACAEGKGRRAAPAAVLKPDRDVFDVDPAPAALLLPDCEVIGQDVDPPSPRCIVLQPERDVIFIGAGSACIVAPEPERDDILIGARSACIIAPEPERDDIPFDAPFSPLLEPDCGRLVIGEDAACRFPVVSKRDCHTR